jgi:serine phosphatase RsbU (regulator of sigma subunit)
VAKLWGERPRVIGGIAVAVLVPVAVALIVEHDTPRTNVPGGLMTLGVLVATALGGLWVGLFAAAIAAVTFGAFFVGPSDTLIPRDGTELAAFVIYAVVSVAVTLTTALLIRQVRREAEQSVSLQTRLEAEQETLLAVQQALLPSEPPIGSAFEVCLRYRAADRVANLGGDWYAVVPLPGDRLGLAIGDVVGHGLASVALMAEIRFALRAVASEDLPPPEVLRRLHSLVNRFDPDAMCTAVYGVIDAERLEWEQAVAGHPPPLLRDGDRSRFLELAPPGPPLGAGNDVHYPIGRVALPPAATLLLYTDGLVERRGESIDRSLHRLRQAVVQGPPDPDDLCGELLGSLAAAPVEDDVALVAARVRAATG